MKGLTSLLVVGTLALAAAGWCADSPQFRGPARDGKYPETGLLKQWPEGGPKLLWTATGLGGGWSSATVANGTVYVTGMDANTKEGTLFAFDLDGKAKWKVSYGPESEGGGHPGARTTPTVDGDRVWVMSSTGRLASFEAATGRKLLDVDTIGRFKGQPPQWAIAESPLVDGDRVICTPGGPDAGLVALNKDTGETVWTTKGLGEPSSFCSPNLVRVGDRRLIVTEVKGLVVGVDAEKGEVLWRQPLANRMGIQPDTPVFADGMLFANAGRGTGAVGLQLAPDGSSVTQKWAEQALDGFHHGQVVVDGMVYGSTMSQKALVCLELATGKAKWAGADAGVGSAVYADGMIYSYDEKGTVHLVKADPAAFQQVSSFQVTQGTGEHWAHPTIANGRLYLRHGDVLMAFDIAAR